MGEVGATQNISKQENILYLAGQGAHKLSRRLHSGFLAGVEGVCKHHVRFLGGHFSPTFSPVPELGKRQNALRVSFYTMG
eukprot:4108759-Pyramimonas_sp.AAC.1